MMTKLAIHEYHEGDVIPEMRIRSAITDHIFGAKAAMTLTNWPHKRKPLQFDPQ